MLKQLAAVVTVGAAMALGGQAPAVDFAKPGPQVGQTSRLGPADAAGRRIVEMAHVTVALSASPAVAAPGHKVSLFLDVTPKPKIHVYAPGQEGYIPIALTLDADPAFTAAKPIYPAAAEKYYMPVLKETQLVYSKPFRLTQNLTIALSRDVRQRAAAPDASLTIKGTLRYQACDDQVCFLPQNVPVEWTVRLR